VPGVPDGQRRADRPHPTSSPMHVFVDGGGANPEYRLLTPTNGFAVAGT
jgi:hypothetical protein